MHTSLYGQRSISPVSNLAISSIAFALPEVKRLLGHILSAYHTDMENDVFPAYTNPPQPFDDQVVLGRALCKVVLIE